jgi:hypothetical protein
MAHIGTSSGTRFDINGSIESEKDSDGKDRVAFVDAFLAQAREKILVELNALDSKKVTGAHVGLSLELHGELNYSVETEVKLDTGDGNK